MTRPKERCVRARRARESVNARKSPYKQEYNERSSGKGEITSEGRTACGCTASTPLWNHLFGLARMREIAHTRRCCRSRGRGRRLVLTSSDHASTRRARPRRRPRVQRPRTRRRLAGDDTPRWPSMCAVAQCTPAHDPSTAIQRRVDSHANAGTSTLSPGPRPQPSGTSSLCIISRDSCATSGSELRNMAMSQCSWKRTGAPPAMARRPATARARFAGGARDRDAGWRAEGAGKGVLRAELTLPRQARPEAEGGHRAAPARHEPQHTVDAECREPKVAGIRRERTEAELVAPGLHRQRSPRHDVSDSASAELAAQREQDSLAGLGAVDDDAPERPGEALEDVRRRPRAGNALLNALEVAVTAEEQRAHQPAPTWASVELHERTRRV